MALISGVVIISSPQWYPLGAVLRSMVPVCDEIVVNADASVEGTIEETERVLRELNHPAIRMLTSWWNWQARDGGQELARQTNLAVEHTAGSWVLSLQADEVLADDSQGVLEAVLKAPSNVTGFRMRRLYFWRRPNLLRADWTVALTRLFRKGSHVVVGDAMNTRTLYGQTMPLAVDIFHYSRLAGAQAIVRRIRRLSELYHDPATLDVPDRYDWVTRTFDTYSSENRRDAAIVDSEEVIVEFIGRHPTPILPYLAQLALDG